MKQDRIIPDKTEIVVIDTSGKIPRGVNLPYHKILRIAFNPCIEVDNKITLINNL